MSDDRDRMVQRLEAIARSVARADLPITPEMIEAVDVLESHADQGEPGPVLRLVMTCGACPEQYDAFDGSVRVGYLRLRHGSFTVDAPDYTGKQVLHEHPNGDGCFEDDERDFYLRKAVRAIKRELNLGYGDEYVTENTEGRGW